MSEKATRDSFGEALRDLGKEFPNIVALDADLSCSTKSVFFKEKFPERFFQMGIAESNMVGTAAGLAFTGYVPFICSFGAFVAGRYETIRMSIGYSKANVKIVGTHAGLGLGEDGYSQMGLEDVNVLRALPGMHIVQPCDHVTTLAAVRCAATTPGPFYLRLTRQKLAAIHKSPDVFQLGKGIVVRRGGELALVGSGSTVIESVRASELLSKWNPWIVDMPTIKPIDTQLVQELAKKCRWVVTVEDHSVIGGLGSAVAEELTAFGFGGKLIRIGVGEVYGESGSPTALYEKFGLSGARVAEQVQRFLANDK